jgi:hypothetical protein
MVSIDVFESLVLDCVASRSVVLGVVSLVLITLRSEMLGVVSLVSMSELLSALRLGILIKARLEVS